MKKVLGIFLALAVLCGAAALGTIPASANPDDDRPGKYSYGDLAYEIRYDAEGNPCIDIRPSLDASGDVVIPSSIEGIPVKRMIAVFYWNKKITSVQIPDSVEDISTLNFLSSSLTADYVFISPSNPHLMLSDGFLISKQDMKLIAYIGDSATPSVPVGVKILDDSAFDSHYRGVNFTSITLPNTLEEFGWTPIARCDDLKITIPESVKTISHGIFFYCDNVVVTIPRDTTIISRPEDTNEYNAVFWYCENPTIMGYAGSSAEAFAKEYGTGTAGEFAKEYEINFVEIQPQIQAKVLFWNSWPSWAQAILRYLLFGWLWERWV